MQIKSFVNGSSLKLFLRYHGNSHLTSAKHCNSSDIYLAAKRLDKYPLILSYHFEYASPLLLGLSKGLSTKLELSNALALRTLFNYFKSIPYDKQIKAEYMRIE